MSNTGKSSPSSLELAVRLARFAALLRTLGLPVGTDRVLSGYQAINAHQVMTPEDFFWSLRVLFVSTKEHLPVFDWAFERFWCDDSDQVLVSLGVPTPVQPSAESSSDPQLGEKNNPIAGPLSAPSDDVNSPEIESGLQASAAETLRGKDFEQMSDHELEGAKRAIAEMHLPSLEIHTRRYKSCSHGSRVDMRATLRAALRSGSGFLPLVRRRPRTRPPALVLISDISGSMARYSRMLLHFAHALFADRAQVHAFVFGTRLTNISRQIRERRVDRALARVSEAVLDWDGGTRIGRCIHEFNRRWSRRVLPQGAIVLFISDGLDRDAGEGLAVEMDRLHRSCRHLIWLNPLLRYDRFEPKSLGMQAIIGHVDELRTIHNLASLDALAETLKTFGAARAPVMRR